MDKKEFINLVNEVHADADDNEGFYFVIYANNRIFPTTTADIHPLETMVSVFSTATDETYYIPYNRIDMVSM